MSRAHVNEGKVSDTLELIVPKDFYTNVLVVRSISPPEKPKYGFRPMPAFVDQWTCFIPEVEDWIKENVKLKNRRKIELCRRVLVSARDDFKTDFQIYVKFPNERDLSLFKIWWMV